MDWELKNRLISRGCCGVGATSREEYLLRFVGLVRVRGVRWRWLVLACLPASDSLCQRLLSFTVHTLFCWMWLDDTLILDGNIGLVRA